MLLQRSSSRGMAGVSGVQSHENDSGLNSPYHHLNSHSHSHSLSMESVHTTVPNSNTCPSQHGSTLSSSTITPTPSIPPTTTTTTQFNSFFCPRLTTSTQKRQRRRSILRRRAKPITMILFVLLLVFCGIWIGSNLISPSVHSHFFFPFKTPSVPTSSSSSSSSISLQSQSQNSHSHQPQPQQRLEFVHITKTGGSAIEKAGIQQGVLWGACHYMKIPQIGCFTPDIPYTAPTYQSYPYTSPWHTPPKILFSWQQQEKQQQKHHHHQHQQQHPYQHADLFTVVRNPYDRAVSEYYCPWTGYKGKGHANKEDPATMNRWIYNMVTSMERLLQEFQQKHKQPPSFLDTQEEDPQSKQQEEEQQEEEDPYLLAQKHFINQVEYVYDDQDVQIIQHVLYYETLYEDFDRLMTLYNQTKIQLSRLETRKKMESKDSISSTQLPNPNDNNNNNGVYAHQGKLTYLDLYPETIAVINRYAKRDFEKFGYEMVETFGASKKQPK